MVFSIYAFRLAPKIMIDVKTLHFYMNPSLFRHLFPAGNSRIMTAEKRSDMKAQSRSTSLPGITRGHMSSFGIKRWAIKRWLTILRHMTGGGKCSKADRSCARPVVHTVRTGFGITPIRQFFPFSQIYAKCPVFSWKPGFFDELWRTPLL